MQRSRLLVKGTKTETKIKSKIKTGGNVYPFYFVLGALILYLVFSVIPSFVGLLYSFTDWNSFSSEINFVGFDNFATIFSADENYLSFIKNTLIFTIVTIVLKTVLALLFALLLTEGIKKFSNFHRLMIYLPVVLPTLVVGLLFKSILNPETGVLNEFL